VTVPRAEGETCIEVFVDRAGKSGKPQQACASAG
jgi:hypothetical protein